MNLFFWKQNMSEQRRKFRFDFSKIKSKIVDNKYIQNFNKKIDKTIINPHVLKNRLRKWSKVKVLATDEIWYKEILDELVTLKWENEFTLNIWWWALFGIISYGIACDMLKRWIKPTEYIWNSAGWIVASFLATNRTDDRYFDYMLAWLDDKPVLKLMLEIPHLVISKLIPFFIKIYIDGKELPIEEIFLKEPMILFEKLLKIPKNDIFEKWLDEDNIKYLIMSSLEDIDPEYWNYSYSKIKLHKITLNEIKEQYWVSLRLFATSVDSPSVSEFSIFRPLLFAWDHSVVDSLIYSTAASWVYKGNIDWVDYYITDWYYSRKQFASLEADFESPENVKILLQTDTTPWLIWFCGLPYVIWLPEYGVNDYVISPDLWFMYSFNYKEMWKIKKILNKYTNQ